jgi:hypothetical protein
MMIAITCVFYYFAGKFEIKREPFKPFPITCKVVDKKCIKYHATQYRYNVEYIYDGKSYTASIVKPKINSTTINVNIRSDQPQTVTNIVEGFMRPGSAGYGGSKSSYSKPTYTIKTVPGKIVSEELETKEKVCEIADVTFGYTIDGVDRESTIRTSKHYEIGDEHNFWTSRLSPDKLYIYKKQAPKASTVATGLLFTGGAIFTMFSYVFLLVMLGGYDNGPNGNSKVYDTPKITKLAGNILTYIVGGLLLYVGIALNKKYKTTNNKAHNRLSIVSLVFGSLVLFINMILTLKITSNSV